MPIKCVPEKITPQEYAAISQRVYEALTGDKPIKSLTEDEKIGLENLLLTMDKIGNLVGEEKLSPQDQILFNQTVKELKTKEARSIIAKVRQALKAEGEPEPGALDKVAEYTAAMYLWRLSSVGKSFVSNLARNFLKYPEAKMAAWFNKGIVRRNKIALSRFPEEAMMDFRATWMNGEFKKSFEEAKKIMKEDPDAIKGSVFFKREQIKPQAIKGTKGKIIRAGLNAQAAIDVFFRVPAIQGELAKLVWRKAMKETGDRIEALSFAQDIRATIQDIADMKKTGEKVPEEFAEYEEMLAQAEKNAQALTFQSELSGIAKTLSEARKHPLARIFVPFFNTQMNILKQAFERTPFSIATPEMISLGKKFITREITEAEAGQLADRASQIAFGTAVFSMALAAFMLMSDDDEITGDYDEKTISDKPKGWQPNSIRIGDRYISYMQFEPFATMFRVWGNMRESGEYQKMIESGKISDKLLHGLEASLNSLAKVTISNPLTEEVFDIVNAVREGKVIEFFDKMVAGMVLPGIVQDASKIIDPTVRRKEGLLEKGLSQAGAPGSMIGLPPMVDVFGEPLQPQSRGERALKTVTGIAISRLKEDAARKELRRLKLKFSVRTYTHKGVQLIPDETLRLNKAIGVQFKKEVLAMLRNPTYQRLSTKDKRDRIKTARRKLLDKYKKAIERHPAFKGRQRAKKREEATE